MWVVSTGNIDMAIADLLVSGIDRLRPDVRYIIRQFEVSVPHGLLHIRQSSSDNGLTFKFRLSGTVATASVRECDPYQMALGFGF